MSTQDPSVARLRWTSAAALALAVHVALFAALGQRQFVVPTGETPMAQAIELDLAAGETAAAQAAPTETADAAAEARPQAPKATPPAAREETATPIAQAPPAVVAPAKKPPVARRAVDKPAPRTAPDTSMASRKIPRHEATPSRGGRAAAEASGSSLSIGDWNSLVSAQIRRNQRYPDSARLRGEEGVATIAFNVARSGAIGAARLAASSGYPDLDAEALAAVRRSNPLPPPPGILGAPVSRNVPIRFGLR